MRLTRSFTVLALAAALLAPLAARPVDAQPKTDVWREMYMKDLAFARETIATRYIYARAPGGGSWDKLFAEANRQAEADAEKVNDFAGYRAALQRYAEAFADAHLRVRLELQAARVAWPRFLVRYESGRYLVVESQTPAVAKGAAITACDGKPVDALVAERSPPLGRAAGGEDGSPLLESARDLVARTLFIDAKSPFVTRPTRCRIGEADVELTWTPIPADQLAKLSAPYDLMRDPATTIKPFGRNNVRIRMSTFAPGSLEEAKQFHAVIAAAPSLRDKDIVVLDVRGNGGGNYNWFTAFLEAFYGADYADHYAIARLKITPVFVDDPSRPAKPLNASAPDRPRTDPLNTPQDRPMDGLLQGYFPRPAANGTTVYAAKLGALPAAVLRPPPPSPVKARVFVLTDYNCASACISFLDELHRIPGVVQVGRESGVDSRTGTPLNYALPSGNGELTVPCLVREGRERGDNIPWRPDVRFDGDIADTAAVLAWVETLPAKRGRTAAR
jgi:Peptidase family S41